jgi:hypothetical protein
LYTCATWLVHGDVGPHPEKRLSTEFVSETELTVLIRAEFLTKSASAQVVVTLCDPMADEVALGYPRSNPIHFTVVPSP